MLGTCPVVLRIESGDFEDGLGVVLRIGPGGLEGGFDMFTGFAGIDLRIESGGLEGGLEGGFE